MDDTDNNAERRTGQGHTPWAVGQHPWPRQIGCCPLVGRPWSVHDTNNRNVAAAVSEDIARLIAHAPNMLNVLRHYRDQMCEGFCVGLKTQDEYSESMDFDCAGCKARAEIARATGGAS